MRLLYFDDAAELSLTQDLIEKIPQYAILSHTWGADEDEIKFSDIQNGNYKSKAAYTKLQFCGQQAQRDGLRYFWVDTCCIDKSSSAELSEAIVSMFKWYKRATKCYIYLSDVHAREREHDGDTTQRSWESAFRESRWFTRGWTLQELLAPDTVEFFSSEGMFLADRETMQQMIHEITTIPRQALCGALLRQFSDSERMRWAEQRVTTRVEDKWYCLQGILEVVIPPMYGEEELAAQRLKDAIASSYRTRLDINGHGHLSHFIGTVTPTKLGSPLTTSQTEIISAHDRRETLLASLKFNHMETRQSTIKNAYAATCRWLFKHPAYLEWIDPDAIQSTRGVLWINGKPGAGKSTLIKFAHANAIKANKKHEIVIAFFFNARGHDLEKSTLGMYRSLLYQLLQKAPDLQSVLDELPVSLNDPNQPLEWTTDVLVDLLSIAVAKLGQRKLKCFVDALDECEEQQVQDMVLHFEDLGHAALGRENQFSVCFASRHYPTIIIRSGRKLILEDQNSHIEDLSIYIKRHLRAGDGKGATEIQMQVQEKANGIFLWAVLVIDILNKEFRRGKIFAVRKRLREIPEKLGDLFKQILRRDKDNLDDLLLCLQLILFAKRPMSREEFYFAMAAGLDADNECIIEWRPEYVTESNMNHLVLNSSKGLAELTKSKVPTVQFIHESVRDFLLEDKGLYELWPELEDDIHCLSHERLRQCCQKYLSIDRSPNIPSEKLPRAASYTGNQLRQALSRRFPFLEYANGNVLYHANEAATVFPQHDFLMQFSTSS